MIKVIKDKFDPILLKHIEIAKKYHEVYLSELSYIMSSETSSNITKSGLSHRFRKIHEIAEKIRNEKS